jgi:subtilase-type serine protease
MDLFERVELCETLPSVVALRHRARGRLGRALSGRVIWLLASISVSGAEEMTREELRKPLDIRAPGSDLANFPNSAFTLPQGGFYLELSPISYTTRSQTLSAQYNFEYLLRYGLFDWMELRLYSQGLSVQGNPQPAVGFSPLTFDTKIHFWNEFEDYYLPAAGLEIMLQTSLLGSPAFDSGTEPSFSLNFDQTLPWGLAFEYNIGAARFEDPDDISQSVWDVTFAWAIQKDVVEDLAVFLNGYYNAANLPRIGRLSDTSVVVCPRPVPCQVEELVRRRATANGNESQHAIGAGGIWTLNDHVALFVNLAAGVTPPTPSFTSFVGLAWTP